MACVSMCIKQDIQSNLALFYIIDYKFKIKLIHDHQPCVRACSYNFIMAIQIYSPSHINMHPCLFMNYCDIWLCKLVVNLFILLLWEMIYFSLNQGFRKSAVHSARI